MKFFTIVASALLAVAVVDAVCMKDMCTDAKTKCSRFVYDGAAHCQIRCGRTNMTCVRGCVAEAAKEIAKKCSPKDCDMAFLLKYGEKTYEYCIDG